MKKLKGSQKENLQDNIDEEEKNEGN